MKKFLLLLLLVIGASCLAGCEAIAPAEEQSATRTLEINRSTKGVVEPEIKDEDNVKESSSPFDEEIIVYYCSYLRKKVYTVNDVMGSDFFLTTFWGSTSIGAGFVKGIQSHISIPYSFKYVNGTIVLKFQSENGAYSFKRIELEDSDSFVVGGDYIYYISEYIGLRNSKVLVLPTQLYNDLIDYHCEHLAA